LFSIFQITQKLSKTKFLSTTLKNLPDAIAYIRSLETARILTLFIHLLHSNSSLFGHLKSKKWNVINKQLKREKIKKAKDGNLQLLLLF
jgi:hypothetical protein